MIWSVWNGPFQIFWAIRYGSTLYYHFYLAGMIFFLWSRHETITHWHESIHDKPTDSETNIIPFWKFMNFQFKVILLMKTFFELNFFLMSPWTTKNKPIKPKERLKILLMVIFWSDPSKYPFKWFAQSPWPSWLNWPDSFGSEFLFWKKIFQRTMPSMTRISENELHPSIREVCKNTSNRYEQTISTEKTWFPKKILLSGIFTIPKFLTRVVERLYFRLLTSTYLFFS